MSLAFSNVDLPSDDELSAPGFKTSAARYAALALHSAELRFTDDSLIEKINADAKTNGRATPADMLGLVAGFSSREPASQTPFMTDAVPKLQQFLRAGGSIALQAKPSADLPLVQIASPVARTALMNPEALARQLGLSVEVSR